MINYLIEFSSLYAFCGLSFLLIHKLSNHKISRGFIVSALMLSLILPLMPRLIQEGFDVFNVLLPEALISAGEGSLNSESKVNSGISFINLLWTGYFICSLVLFLRFLFAVLKLVNIISTSDQKEIEGKRVVLSNQVKNPCSFFNYILLPKQAAIEEKELSIIIEHESYHIRFGHSLERLVFEFLNVFIWWHPVHYLFKSKLALIHEYEVDEAMTQHVQPNFYKEILLQLIINPPGLRMSNPFSSHIKQRIKMMNNQKKKISIPLAVTMFTLIFGGMIFIHACAKDGDTTTTKKIEKRSAEKTEKFYTTEVVDTIVTFDSDTYEESVKIVSSNMTVYNEPDVMPMFPGCDETDAEALKACSTQKLLEFIYKNIKYPEEARTNNIEGMVLVKFVVNQHGFIEQSEYLKTLGYGIEDTVDDMLRKMQQEIKWIPGKVDDKNVNVAFTLPVKFKLQG